MADEHNGAIGPAAPAGMGAVAKIAVVAAVLAAGCAAFWLKGKDGSPPPVSQGSAPKPSAALPRLVDLGAGKCIPCKMMAPILEELKAQHAGRLDVVFIDVWQNPDAGRPYGIRVIPTQIFYSPDGKELFRHEGFFSKEDILKKWKELGFEFAAAKP